MRSLFFILFILAGSTSYGQWVMNKPSKVLKIVTQKSNKELYKIEYELVDESLLGDSSILATLDLNRFKYFREQTNDITFTDKYNGIAVIIYSFDKIRDIKYPKSDIITETRSN